jgi:CRP-like cAMP-binding protein
MSAPTQLNVRNRLLRLMSADDFDRLAPDLTFVELHRADVLVQADNTVEAVYFPETAISSTIAISPENHQVEAGLIGRDGYTPMEPVLGADRAINRVVIQLPGDGWRVGSEALVRHLAESPPLRLLLTRFAHVMGLQAHYTALSNAVHPIDERLARWLLMCDDRVDGSKLELTHEFISLMLAVRRPSVTTALHVLEGNGFIRSERGCIIIRNRQALEDFAKDAYGKPEAEYRRLIGPLQA